jgi:hypothetical protein
METIEIAYSLRIEGKILPLTKFDNTLPEFKNSTLRPIPDKKNMYEVLIKKNVYSSDEKSMKAIFDESFIEAEKLKYTLSIAAEIKIYDFDCIGYYKNGIFASYRSIFSSFMLSGSSATLTVGYGDQSMLKIKERMKNDYNLPIIRMFYDSVTIIEPIGRFISLYALLLHVFDDKQKLVDEAILKEDTTVGQIRSPHNGEYETIFSKLRNEMSHKRSGVNILETQDTIKANIDRFESIVKNIVLIDELAKNQPF